MALFWNWIISAAAIAVASYLLPGVSTDGFVAALAVAVVLGLINATIKPLAHVLALPLSVLTLGLFALVINGALVLLASAAVPGFHVDGLASAIFFSIVLAAVNFALSLFRAP